jgi:hypothetical protein
MKRRGKLASLALDFVLFSSVILSFPFLWLGRKLLGR